MRAPAGRSAQDQPDTCSGDQAELRGGLDKLGKLGVRQRPLSRILATTNPKATTTAGIKYVKFPRKKPKTQDANNIITESEIINSFIL